MTANVRIASAIVAGFILAGCVSTPENSMTVRSAATRHDPTCLTDTGVPVNGAKCVGFGRSYSSDDIMRTGATSLGEALPLLDPSFTVHR
ncbi:MAG TPA: hypothetical protein VNR70_06910 [Steroidobacteraceae bacterium]|jgi:hypothetical protein|nr:hypothetical protein [Steroidobacteraceae bacterium]